MKKITTMIQYNDNHDEDNNNVKYDSNGYDSK